MTAQAAVDRIGDHPDAADITLQRILEAFADPVRRSIVRQIARTEGDTACGTFDISVTRSTGTQAHPVANECVNANTSTYQCTSDDGLGGAINSNDDISDSRSTFAGNRAVSVTPTGVTRQGALLLGRSAYNCPGLSLKTRLVASDALL